MHSRAEVLMHRYTQMSACSRITEPGEHEFLHVCFITFLLKARVHISSRYPPYTYGEPVGIVSVPLGLRCVNALVVIDPS